MKVDNTTPAIMALLETAHDVDGGASAFDAAEIAERTGIPLGTVTGWLTKKMPINQVSYDVVEGRRKYRFDPTKVIMEAASADKKRKPRGVKAKQSVAAPRRKPGAEYAEIIHRSDGANVGSYVVLWGPCGELIKGIVV